MTSPHELEVIARPVRLRGGGSAAQSLSLKACGYITAKKETFARRATRNAGSWTARGKSPACIIRIHGGGRAGDKYAEQSKGARFLDGSMLGRNYREREEEWSADQLRHPAVKNLFVHVSISLAKEVVLTRPHWISLARDWLTEIGAVGVNYTIAQHTHSQHDHLHIIFSRALPSGSLLSDSLNFYKWRSALRRAEEMNGISAVDLHRDVAFAGNNSDAQVNAMRRAVRRGTPPNLAGCATITDCLMRSIDFEDFVAQLAEIGIQVQISRRANGEPRGILYRTRGSAEFLAGSSVSKYLSLPHIDAVLRKNNGGKRERFIVDRA